MTAAISPVAGSTTSASTPTQVERPDQFGKDTFLRLLVAQLKYQNPLQPTDPSAFLSQTAQFSVVEKMQQLADLQQSASSTNQITMGAALIGKQVTYEVDGASATGTVSAVRFSVVSGTAPTLHLLDGKDVPLNAVTAVQQA